MIRDNERVTELARLAIENLIIIIGEGVYS